MVFASGLFVRELPTQQSQSEREQKTETSSALLESSDVVIMAAQTRPQKFNPQRALSQVAGSFTRIQQINKALG